MTVTGDTTSTGEATAAGDMTAAGDTTAARDVMATLSASPDATAVPPRPTFYRDIAGLRGIAVLLVVLFHSHVPYVTGGFIGVDVFFVISGYLITGILIREFERSDSLSFRHFYARRARRIVPAATLAIVVSVIAAAVLLPLLTVFKQAIDLLAAAALMANWHFIAQNADYLAGSINGSLATHFWSLSIEEQLYFVWPLLIFATACLASRTLLAKYVPMRAAVAVVIALATVISLIIAIRLTPADPATAYMATYTRVWQFGIGGLLAAATPLVAIIARAPRVAAVITGILGWAGLAGIVVAMLVIDTQTPYPGTAALLPTLAAAAVIASGWICGTGFTFAGFLLATAPFRIMGRVSYSWYLWHWPAIVLFESTTDIHAWPALIGISAVSLVIATGTTLLFEEPLIGSRELRRNMSASLSVGVTGLVIGLTVTLTAGVASVQLASRNTLHNSTLSYASVFEAPNRDPSGAVVPNPFQAYDDRTEPHECLIPVGQQSAGRDCTFGPVGGIPVVLFGDSHAEQWAGALRTIGNAHGWRLHQFTKAACPAQALRAKGRVPDPYAKAECSEWRSAALQQIAAVRPRIIVVSSLSTYVPDAAQETVAWDITVAHLRATGAKIVYIADTPYPGFQIADCMSGALDNWHRCDFLLDGFTRIEPILAQQARGYNTDILTVGVNNLLCQANLCLPARNKVLLYRDDSHLTATAVRLLEPALAHQLDAAGFDYGAR